MASPLSNSSTTSPGLYLPRLAGPEVLAQSIRDGVALLTWRTDAFAYAESFDEAAGRYRGLQAAQRVNVASDSAGLVVKPDVAARQLEAEVEFKQFGRRISIRTVPKSKIRHLRRLHPHRHRSSVGFMVLFELTRRVSYATPVASPMR